MKDIPGSIVLSWFISPVLSGVIGLGIFALIKCFIIRAEKPLEAGLTLLPAIYGLTIFVNIVSITLDGSKCE
jgi:phosphate/sulfate permease